MVPSLPECGPPEHEREAGKGAEQGAEQDGTPLGVEIFKNVRKLDHGDL
jgi:hypothetical protein